MAFLLIIMLMAGCTPKNAAKTETTKFIAETVAEYEAENGEFLGKVTKKEDSGCSGNAYVTGFEGDDDIWQLKIEAPADDFYDLEFVLQGIGGSKINNLFVDGEKTADLTVNGTTYENVRIKRVWLDKGEHVLKITKSWGWINLDRVSILTSEPLNEDFYKTEVKLVNPNATEEAKRLMSYLTDVYGKYFISGQVCDEGPNGAEFRIIKEETGETPAILGIDLFGYTPVAVKNGSKCKTVEYATEHWNNGGIVEMHWHWQSPEGYYKGPWYSSFYTKDSTLDLKKIMSGKDSKAYKLLMEDIDAIAKELQRLQDENVPILFRPLHEASGGWFWWGASGAESYKELYKLLYNKLTNEYKLNNLIWLWNGQDKSWYPGDEYVDIIGIDIYPGERVYTSQIDKYLEISAWTEEKKMLYLSECGCIFDPDIAIKDGAMWGMWAVWQGEFVKTGTNKLSEQYTEEYMLKKAYSHEKVITLKDVPNLRKYPIAKTLK